MDRAGFLAKLTEYGDLARAALIERLPHGEPRAYLYDPMRDYVAHSGKGLRPALLIASCRAFGGRMDEALTSAAVVELLHNAFLIHDDIQDLSEFRRGRPCLHERMGVPLAINAGDAMLAHALRMLRSNIAQLGPARADRILDEFDHLIAESLEGQAMELGWILDNDLTVGTSDYLRMTLKKTCWYSFIHPVRIGALIAQPGRTDLDRFNAFGFYLGAAFQIQDDVLNLIGSVEKYGKEIHGDIYEGKRTLMLSRLAALADASELDRLSRFLALPRPQRDTTEVKWVYEAMQRHGTIGFARDASRKLVEGARAAFQTAFAEASGEDREFIGYCLDFMIEREA